MSDSILSCRSFLVGASLGARATLAVARRPGRTDQRPNIVWIMAADYPDRVAQLGQIATDAHDPPIIDPTYLSG